MSGRRAAEQSPRPAARALSAGWGAGGWLEMRSSFSMGAMQHACTALCQERAEGNLS